MAIPGGYSTYPWVGRCGAAPHNLTLFKTNIADFPTLFKTEFRFLIPCLRHLINIRACKNFAVYRPRKDIPFKTKIDKSIPWLRQKMINSIPCLRQKSRKTYSGWPHVPIKPLSAPGPYKGVSPPRPGGGGNSRQSFTFPMFKVSFKVNKGNKFWDFGYCTLN